MSAAPASYLGLPLLPRKRGGSISGNWARARRVTAKGGRYVDAIRCHECQAASEAVQARRRTRHVPAGAAERFALVAVQISPPRHAQRKPAIAWHFPRRIATQGARAPRRSAPVAGRWHRPRRQAQGRTGGGRRNL